MINRSSFEHATFTVNLSMMVKAKRKNQAMELADFQLNEKNMILDRMRLVNDRGVGHFFMMKRIESIRWMSIESTGYSNLFRVLGQIRLELISDKYTEQYDHSRAGAYRLPRSVLQDKTIWVIQTSNEPSFTQVLSQSLEFNIPKDSISLTNVG